MPITAKETLKLAKDFKAKKEIIVWLESLDPEAIPWNICDRADWMLWFAVKMGIDIKLIGEACCNCARLSLNYVPENERKPLQIIEKAEAWIRDEATIIEVKSMNDDNASNSANTAYASCAAYMSAAYAIYSTYVDRIDTAADYASATIRYVTYASTDPKEKVLKQCADIVRKTIPSLN